MKLLHIVFCKNYLSESVNSMYYNGNRRIPLVLQVMPK